MEEHAERVAKGMPIARHSKPEEQTFYDGTTAKKERSDGFQPYWDRSAKCPFK